MELLKRVYLRKGEQIIRIDLDRHEITSTCTIFLYQLEYFCDDLLIGTCPMNASFIALPEIITIAENSFSDLVAFLTGLGYGEFQP
jgi:hypothetical protein